MELTVGAGERSHVRASGWMAHDGVWMVG